MAYGTINVDTVTTSTTGGILGAGNASIMKNRIINGAMVIDQRNAGASVNATAVGGVNYVLDRFGYSASQASKFTVQQNAGSITPATGFTNYLGVTSSSAYSVVSGDYFGIRQRIEGYNISDLGWGTANAKTVTLSFWVYSSLTGTFGGSLANSAENRSYPFTYTVSSANTWQQISVTIAGDTSGTWLTTNGIGIQLNFSLGTGTTYSGTAGAWAGSTLLSATGATSVVGTSGATFYITGVQLEVGSSATGYEYRQYGQEFDLCRRYYEIWRYAGDGSTNMYLPTGVAYNTNDARTSLYYYPKRANPTCAFSGTVRFGTAAGGTNITSFNFDSAGVNSALIYNNATSGFTLGQALQASAQAATTISFSSEL